MGFHDQLRNRHGTWDCSLDLFGPRAKVAERFDSKIAKYMFKSRPKSVQMGRNTDMLKGSQAASICSDDPVWPVARHCVYSPTASLNLASISVRLAWNQSRSCKQVFPLSISSSSGRQRESITYGMWSLSNGRSGLTAL